MIVKTRFSCAGDGEVELSGVLSEGPLIGPGVPKATHTATRAVVAGKTYTFYVPASGDPGIPCHSASYYQGSTTVEGVVGTGTTVSSNKVQAARP